VADELTAAIAEAQGDNSASVTFHGQEFKVAQSIGLMPLMMFASAAKSGLNTSDMDGLAAMHALLEDSLDPEDWPRFQRACIDAKIQADELLEVIKELIEAVAARPTQQPSDSSDGQQGTTPSSRGDSSTAVSLQDRKRALGIVPVDEAISSAV
jgi:hypothetical protein